MRPHAHILDLGSLLPTTMERWSQAIILYPPGIGARALYSLILLVLIAAVALRYSRQTAHGARIVLIAMTVLFGLSSIISFVTFTLSGGIAVYWASFAELLRLELDQASLDLEHNLWKLLIVDAARFGLIIVPLASVISSWLLFKRGAYRLAVLASLAPLINIVPIVVFSL